MYKFHIRTWYDFEIFSFSIPYNQVSMTARIGLKSMPFKPLRFINEAIDVIFESPPAMEKKPGCPDGFAWREGTFRISETLSEWHDYERRGRLARNMRPANAREASKRGSWGVGQDYYRIKTEESRIFEIYYDRAPKNVNMRKGQWFLYRELVEHE